MTVSIVIPNWNGVYLLKKHLKNVLTCVGNAEVIVSDDMSTDGSVAYLQKDFPDIIIVEGKKREGFAVNVNRGVAKATGDIVVLLNTDVEPEKGFLKPLTRHFKDPKVFAVGCLEKSWENGKAVLRGRGVGHWEKGFFLHARGEVDKTDTAWVSGGSGAFRKTMWNALGGMDTVYNPFYWEDIDLSYRARKAGWKTLFEPKSVVNHYHEEGKIKREYNPSEVKKIVYRNQFFFIWKNLSDPILIVSHLFWLPVRIFQAVLRADTLMIIGFFSALSQLPVVLYKSILQRKQYQVQDIRLSLYR